MRITIAHLYPHEMNIYGDNGNRLILEKRMKWRGIEVSTNLIGPGQPLPADTDILIGGGGQDSGQGLIQADFQSRKSQIEQMVSDGVVMLLICGLYQLFGRQFVTRSGDIIPGIGVFPIDTVGADKRMIGNTIYQTAWGTLAGYENHSGVTTLDDTSQALGQVIKGDGNNGTDKTEGCIVNNAFGTYSHGPLLSKNPQFADELISRALQRKYQLAELTPLDDNLELQAAAVARQRPR